MVTLSLLILIRSIMKRSISLFLLLFIVSLTYSQDQLAKGNFALDFNTGLNALSEGGITFMQGSTALQLTTIDDYTFYNIGVDGSYFVQDALALKIGFGYGGVKESGEEGYNSFSYRAGLKYYISNMIPFQVDLTGAQIKEMEDNPMWLGLQGGYAFFLGSNVSLEPNLRYSLSLNEDFTDDSVFQFNVGMSLFF